MQQHHGLASATFRIDNAMVADLDYAAFSPEVKRSRPISMVAKFAMIFHSSIEFSRVSLLTTE